METQAAPTTDSSAINTPTPTPPNLTEGKQEIDQGSHEDSDGKGTLNVLSLPTHESRFLLPYFPMPFLHFHYRTVYTCTHSYTSPPPPHNHTQVMHTSRHTRYIHQHINTKTWINECYRKEDSLSPPLSLFNWFLRRRWTNFLSRWFSFPPHAPTTNPLNQFLLSCHTYLISLYIYGISHGSIGARRSSAVQGTLHSLFALSLKLIDWLYPQLTHSFLSC